MRSYSAARRSFSVLEFFARALIAIGALATIPALMALEARGLLAIVGAMPGVGIMAMGFFGQAYAQTARASVDSAEYAQQSLSLAREQHEISKQMLRMAQTGEPGATYDPPSEPDTLKDISFDTAETAPVTPVPAPVKQDPNRKIDRVHRYSQKRIEESEGKFLIEGKSFDTLDAAKIAIDEARERGAIGLS